MDTFLLLVIISGKLFVQCNYCKLTLYLVLHCCTVVLHMIFFLIHCFLHPTIIALIEDLCYLQILKSEVIQILRSMLWQIVSSVGF